MPSNGSERPSTELRIAEYIDEMFAEFENIQTELDHLKDRIESLEGYHESPNSQRDSVFDDPDLVHEVAHACITSGSITESEELEIPEGLQECNRI